MTLFNKKLGITSNDVIIETDYMKLKSWEVELENQISNMGLSIQALNVREIETGIKTKKSHSIVFARSMQKKLLRLVKKQIVQIEEDSRNEKTIAYAFMEVASKVLDDEVYGKIMKQAQDIHNAII